MGGRSAHPPTAVCADAVPRLRPGHSTPLASEQKLGPTAHPEVRRTEQFAICRKDLTFVAIVTASAGGRAARAAAATPARSLGWIMMHLRLTRDYETKPAHSESMIRLAMISNLAKRATGETPTIWRKP